MKGNQDNKWSKIFILGLLSAVGPFSIDMYLPGFTSIAKELHADVSKVSLTLSAFFIGISIGQLLYGPLLDKYGRKRPLYLGLLIYIVASLGCAVSATVNMLIAFRFVQAIGGCVGLVASRAMVRDLFDVKENARIFSLLMLVVGISPIIAPTLGGYVTATFGWRFVFGALFAIGVIILMLCVSILPESKRPDPDYSLAPRPILKRFAGVFKQSQFVIYALTGSFTAAGMYAYISGSPHVFMEIFGTSEKKYGWIFSIVAGSLILATQINAQLLKFTTSRKIIPRAILVQCLSGLTLLVGSFYNWWGLNMSVVLCCIFLACQGFTFPNASALAIAPFSQNAGSASALMGCLQMAAGALSSALVSIIHNNTAVPMGFVMTVCAVLAFLIFISGKNWIRHQCDKKRVEQQSTDMLSEM